MKRRMPDHDREEIIAAPPLALTMHWKANRLVELRTHWSDDVSETSQPSEDAESLKAALTRYVAGQTPDWPDLPYDFSRLSDFQTAALRELQIIPSGATRTYGEIAARLGKPKGAQAVGRAMGSNPFPIVYPCHRVIGTNGKLTGFSADDGLRMKAWLLRHENAIL